MIRKVIEHVTAHLSLLESRLDLEEFERSVAAIDDASHVWSTGMGKAGLPARKLASTLACVGIPASFIHPGEARHGDLGAVQQGDVLVAFTNSGGTREVVETVDIARVGTVWVTGAPVSRMSPCSSPPWQRFLWYGPAREAGPLGLIPCTSTTIMMIIADALALELAVRRKLTDGEYSRYHHAGYLGQIARERTRHSGSELQPGMVEGSGGAQEVSDD